MLRAGQQHLNIPSSNSQSRQRPTHARTLSDVFLVVHVEQRAVLLALLHVLDVEQELLVEDVVAQRAQRLLDLVLLKQSAADRYSTGH